MRRKLPVLQAFATATLIRVQNPYKRYHQLILRISGFVFEGVEFLKCCFYQGNLRNISYSLKRA